MKANTIGLGEYSDEDLQAELNERRSMIDFNDLPKEEQQRRMDGRLHTQHEFDRAVLEARIDELGLIKIQFTKFKWDELRLEKYSWAKYIDRRIAELEAEL